MNLFIDYDYSDNEYNFNEKQQEFYDFAIQMDMSDRLLVNAPAGTGKTYVCRHIYNNLKNVKILCPTHKAKSLFLKDGIRNVETIHRFLNSTEEIDEKTGERKFILNEPINLSEINLIIVDECSMVNENMFELLESIIDIPIIYTGDCHQLPPVGEEISLVFSKIQNKIILTENMRSKDSISNIYLEKFRKSINENIKVHISRDKKHNINTMLNTYKLNKKNSIICLAYTNKQVKYYNKLIRKHLFLNNENDILQSYYVGEKLLFNGFRDFGNKKYYTSDEIIINKLKIVKKFIPYCHCSCNHILIDCEDCNKINDLCFYCDKHSNKKIKKCDKCGINGRNYPGFHISFYQIEDQFRTIWYKPFVCDLDKLNKIFKQLKDFCKKKQEIKYWRYFYFLKNKYNAYLTYSYSMTIHKSQGSGWDIVFMDINNIRLGRELAPRLSYTAISRHKNICYFI